MVSTDPAAEEESAPGETEPGDSVPGETEPGDSAPGETEPGETVPARLLRGGMPRVVVRTPRPARSSAPASDADPATAAETGASIGLALRGVSAWYGTFRAVSDVTLDVRSHAVTAFIGPSGCGKSTILRTLNRMHETVTEARVDGEILLDDIDIYGPTINAVRVRRVVGMVFQKPNPFPAMSIYDNVASGLRLEGKRRQRELDELVERSLRRAALWDEVKDKLRHPGTSLSGGQQQRLCIARAIAVDPAVVLMDEPCSALDPVSTLRIEELIVELRETYTIVIVTHNLGQAARVSDETAFFTLGPDRAGYLVEAGPTSEMFTSPTNPLTEDYVSGRFG